MTNSKLKIKNEKASVSFGACLLLWLVCAASVSGQIATGGQFRLEQAAVAGGGVQSASGGQFSVQGTAGQSVAGQKATNSPYSAHAGFWNPADLGPTAAGVSISGRVRTSEGRGIRNALLTITSPNGMSRTAITGSRGDFRFDEIEVGQTYIITVRSRRFLFANPTQVLAVNDEVTGLDFTALP